MSTGHNLSSRLRTLRSRTLRSRLEQQVTNLISKLRTRKGRSSAAQADHEWHRQITNLHRQQVTNCEHELAQADHETFEHAQSMSRLPERHQHTAGTGCVSSLVQQERSHEQQTAEDCRASLHNVTRSSFSNEQDQVAS